MSKDKIQKKRIVTWETKDRAGNEVAFASIDLRAPADEERFERMADEIVAEHADIIEALR